jgi:hypothetical protein
MKKFSNLTEREVLAVAISSEQEDGRVYMTFGEDLKERYPDGGHFRTHGRGGTRSPPSSAGEIRRRFGQFSGASSCSE